MRSRTTAVALVILLVATTIVLTGCDQLIGNAVKGAVEQQTGVKVDKSGKQVTIQGKDGQSVTVGGEEGKLAEGFPTEFPQYPGATVKSSSKVTSAKGSIYTAEWTSTDSADAVLQKYAQDLKTANYTIVNQVQGNSGGQTGGVITFKNATQEGAVTVSDESGTTKIAVMVTVTSQ